MDIHRAQRLISALKHVGYTGEMKPDNIDRLFQHWSQSIILENLTEWLLHDCPSRADLERYKHIKSKGYHVLPEANEDNSAILEDIAKQESLISFYEKEVASKQEEIETLQCEAETDDHVAGAKSRWNCFKRLQKGIKAVNPFVDDPDDPPFVHDVFSELTDTFVRLLSAIDEIHIFLDSYAEPDHTALLGTEFEVIPAEKLLIQRQPELEEAFKAIVKSYGDSTLLNGQVWIEINRDQLHLRIKTLSCRLIIEALALLQIFSVCMDTFEERFTDNVAKIQKLISRMEWVKEKLHVEIPKDIPIPGHRVSEHFPENALPDLFSRHTLDDLHELESLLENYVSTGMLAPENIAKLLRDLHDPLQSASTQLNDVSLEPLNLTKAQLEMKEVLTRLTINEA